MQALYVETLLLMVGAYVLGAALACLLFRALRAPARPLPANAHRVDPLPEMAGSTARFGRGAPGAIPEAAQKAPPAAEPAAAREPAQDLQRIMGITAEDAAVLGALGLRRYDAIAALKAEDVRRLDERLGRGRISRENWIEQAQVLARGEETHFARRRARGEIASASPTQDEGEAPGSAEAAPPREAPDAGPATTADGGDAMSPAPPMGSPALERAPDALPSAPDVAERAAFAAPAVRPPPPEHQEVAMPAMPAAAPPPEDNLLRIFGITEEFAALLVGLGIHRYSQVAQWSAADVKRIEERLGIGGRIARENWIEQAQILSRGGDTAFSRDFDRRGAPTPSEPGPHAGPAPSPAGARAAVELSSLRSLRAEAYMNPEPGPQAAQRAAAQDKVIIGARGGDDLKRIRGIGVLIEKKLNAMGIVAYEQIANWRAEDIDRVSQTLDFKGRIERENWIEQARILASGGATEFARRVDRGEAGTGRPRS
jgi:predicted flap endonuclease-1-like 5' DNA nuclease